MEGVFAVVRIDLRLGWVSPHPGIDDLTRQGARGAYEDDQATDEQAASWLGVHAKEPHADQRQPDGEQEHDPHPGEDS